VGTLCSSEADDLMDELPSFQAKRHPFSLRYGPLNKPDVLAKWFQSAHRPSEEVSLSPQLTLTVVPVDRFGRCTVLLHCTAV
jgi:hypothetical protein